MADQKERVTEVEDKSRSGDVKHARNDKLAADQEYAIESHNSPNGVIGNTPSRRSLQPPELVARMSPEERIHIEAKLKRKIDLRLMPMIIIMYILNYIDR
jgi:hypothetical protein